MYSANKDVTGAILSRECLLLWHRFCESGRIFFEVLFKQISLTVPPTLSPSGLSDAPQVWNFMLKEWDIFLGDVSCYSLNNPVWAFLLFQFVSFMQAVELEE